MSKALILFANRAKDNELTEVEHIIEELDSDQPGVESVVTRLANILFIEGIRAYLNENMDTSTSGWPATLCIQRSAS